MSAHSTRLNRARLMLGSAEALREEIREAGREDALAHAEEAVAHAKGAIAALGRMAGCDLSVRSADYETHRDTFRRHVGGCEAHGSEAARLMALPPEREVGRDMGPV